MGRPIRRPQGYENYLSLGEVLSLLDLHSSNRVREDIKAGRLVACQLPSGRKNEPYLIAPDEFKRYKEEWHTPRQVIPQCS